MSGHHGDFLVANRAAALGSFPSTVSACCSIDPALYSRVGRTSPRSAAAVTEVLLPLMFLVMKPRVLVASDVTLLRSQSN